MSETASNPLATAEPQWKPLTSKQRRVLGTLMEKSKTTPDAYPMTFTGLVTGCNQKSNRLPITNYTVEQVESIVDELRSLGAVTIVQGNGRTTKVRHYAYNWLGLSKIEAAIMTELLLRGEQTLGELRTRASRLEPINDIDELKRLVSELVRRNLVIELSPPGRGQLLSHNLYPEWELESLQKSVASGVSGATLDSLSDSEDSDSSTPNPSPANARNLSSNASITTMQQEIDTLKQLVERLSARVIRLEQEIGIDPTTNT
jgi:uncharacterized protein YceH (UPF0502 family)